MFKLFHLQDVKLTMLALLYYLSELFTEYWFR